MLSKFFSRPNVPRMRLAQMAAHFTHNNASNGSSWPGASLADLPKSWNFTSSLPPDEKFPTPAASHKTPRQGIEPRVVKGALFTWVRPETAQDPELLCVSPVALRDLGIDMGNRRRRVQADRCRQPAAWLGRRKGRWGLPLAQCYGGWQFGSGQTVRRWKTISLFEVTNPATKKRYELQLKGAGITPYSRFADGKAVLRSSIREFIVSEALNALKIPRHELFP